MLSKSMVRALGALLVWGVSSGFVQAQIAIPTAQYGNDRTAANLAEFILKPANVNVRSFGKLFSRRVDDSVYAEPLYIPHVQIPGKGAHNVIYVATMSNTVYAFDAEDPAQSDPLWSRQVGPALPTGGGFIQTSWGILSTPVIHSGVMYLVAYIGDSLQNWGLYLCALDITTGADAFGPPAQILFPLNGNQVMATPATLQRAGLLVSHGYLYVGIANFQTQPPLLSSQEGFVYAYSLGNTNSPAAIFQTSRGQGADIWQAGRGLAADLFGFVYASTGNGFYDGATAFGNSVLKLTPGLTLHDWFTPGNWPVLYEKDLDVSASGPILIPGTPYLIAGGKEGVVYILNRSNLGKLQTDTNPAVVAQFQASHGCGLVNCSQTLNMAVWTEFFKTVLYVWDRRDVLRSYRFGLLDKKVSALTQGQIAPEAIGGITLSALGWIPSTGIVWAITTAEDPGVSLVHGTARAFDANDLSKELWNSDINPERDSMGNFAKFSSPLVANGRVYIVTQSNQLNVYGLLN